MKTWTWNKIRKILKTGSFWSIWSEIQDALLETDEKYRPALAAAFSVAKWKDKLYDAPCGLCAFTSLREDSCDGCGLYARGQWCDDDESLFRVLDDSDFKNEVAARKLTKLLCDIYRDEYNKLLKGGK